MSLIDKGRLEIKLGGFGSAPATALTDPTILQRTQEYRRLTGARMVALDKGDIRQKMPATEYHVSRKVDGEFAVLVFEAGEALLVNPGGTVRAGAPAINEAAQLLGKAGAKKGMIAGELFVERPDGRRPRVHDVARAARTPETKQDVDSLRFAAFDVIEYDGKPMAWADAWKKITAVFGKGVTARPVEAVTLKTSDEIEKRFELWVEKEGAEGLVARSETAGLFKIKPRHTLDAAVIGFTEGIDDRAGMLHDLLVALMRQDGTFHCFARVGGGFKEEERREMLSDLKDMVVPSEYAEVNPDHVAYQMVKPEWVIEMSCLDLVSQTTRGASIDRMVLGWNSKAPRFEVVRRLPLASALSPQFVRRRDDKTVRPAEVRVQQVADLVEIAMADRDAKQLQAKKSEILKREVYTKTMKGALMVRKLVMWKTNKEAEGEYPAYVVHFTDFSPNRKTMLEREIRVSSSKSQIEELWKGLAEENIVKGWGKA